jgi:hypothetical protein
VQQPETGIDDGKQDLDPHIGDEWNDAEHPERHRHGRADELEAKDPPRHRPPPSEDVNAGRYHPDRLDGEAEIPPQCGGVVE